MRVFLETDRLVLRRFTSAGADNLVRLRGISNHSHGTGQHARFTTYLLGERHLIARTNRNARLLYIASGRTVDQIDA